MQTIQGIDSCLWPRLAPGTRLAQRRGCQLTFEDSRGMPVHVDAQFPHVADALLMLSRGDSGMQALISVASTTGNTAASHHFRSCLTLLHQSGLCEYVWKIGDREKAVVSSICGSFHLSATGPKPEESIVLSRFACVRRDGPAVVLESPEAGCRIVLSCEEAWSWLGLLAASTSLAAIRGNHGEPAAQFAELLSRTGFLERTEAEESPARAVWEFHDRLFHWRSREGRLGGPQGGTYRHLHSLPAPPAIKPRMSADTFVLPKPSRDGAAKSSSLVEVVERRRSIREQGNSAISAAELGQLLYNALRVQRRMPSEHQELLLKPVPGAGAIHELEAYIVVNRCQDLRHGLYHYHAEQHTLHRLPSPEQQVSALIENAAISWGQVHNLPQILIILASRFPRLAWKYEGIAYRLTLLNAGAVMQCLYLLAADMQLACSALGGGDSAVFAAATGLDSFEETSVAEFAVGSRL